MSTLLCPHSQAYDDLRIQLDRERAAHSEQAEQQRQSFAVERAALSKRYQVGSRGRGWADRPRSDPDQDLDLDACVTLRGVASIPRA